MSFINVIANHSLKEDLEVNDTLTVDNQINSKNILITGSIKLANDATFEGRFIDNYTETTRTIDSEGLETELIEEINLSEKIERIESKINTNVLAHTNNAASIATRYTKTQADANFVNSSDAKVTGELNIRADLTDNYTTLTSMLGQKVDNNTLTNSYTTTTDMNASLDDKVDVLNFASTYLSALAPKANPSFTGSLTVDGGNIVDSIATKLPHTNPTITDTTGNYLTFQGATSTTLKTLLDTKMDNGDLTGYVTKDNPTLNVIDDLRLESLSTPLEGIILNINTKTAVNGGFGTVNSYSTQNLKQILDSLYANDGVVTQRFTEVVAAALPKINPVIQSTSLAEALVFDIVPD
jgi:hypothetical protein